MTEPTFAALGDSALRQEIAELRAALEKAIAERDELGIHFATVIKAFDALMVRVEELETVKERAAEHVARWQEAAEIEHARVVELEAIALRFTLLAERAPRPDELPCLMRTKRGRIYQADDLNVYHAQFIGFWSGVTIGHRLPIAIEDVLDWAPLPPLPPASALESEPRHE